MKKWTLVILLLLSPALFGQGFYLLEENKKIYGGFTAGIGIPKLPTSNFRTPVSVYTGINAQSWLKGKIGVRASASALYTFSLGTSTKESGTLKFSLLYGNLDLMYRISQTRISESAFVAGLGRYSVNQQIHENKSDWATSGFSMGIVSWRQHRKLRSQFELRWHLLFEPESEIQFLTLGYGILF